MYILFDIGGTNMRLAGSRDGVTFGEPVRLQTPADDFDAGVRLFIETAREIARGERIEAVVGGIAGPLNSEKSELARAPHLSGWAGKPLKEEFERKLETRVVIENDAGVVGLGEATAGAGKGYGIVAYITVSTGVGGTRIVDGRIDRGRSGFEPGHQIIDLSGALACEGCDGRGHLEGYISGSAFEKRYGKKPYEVMEPQAWEDAARILAVGLTNVAVFWSPDVIVLGGSMIVGNPAIGLERVRDHFANMLTIFKTPPLVLKAQLGDGGGLHGALTLVKSSCL